MIDALLISNALLWAIVIALALAVVALVRQIGVLHERIAPAGALVGRDGPHIGEPAPVLEVEAWSGRRLTLGGADPGGQATLVLFVSPSCPVCKTILGIAGSIVRSERAVRLVLASDGPRGEHDALIAAHAIDPDMYVLSRELGLAYQVAKLPYAALIDAAGILRAKGLVNTREHVESLFEAMRHGVGSIQEYLARRAAARYVA